jgi:hypothetical protein
MILENPALHRPTGVEPAEHQGPRHRRSSQRPGFRRRAVEPDRGVGGVRTPRPSSTGRRHHVPDGPADASGQADQGRRHPPVRAGRIGACGICGRRVDAHWVHKRPGYRCRHGHTSAAPRPADAPRNVYLREDHLLDALPDLLTDADGGPACAGDDVARSDPVERLQHRGLETSSAPTKDKNSGERRGNPPTRYRRKARPLWRWTGIRKPTTHNAVGHHPHGTQSRMLGQRQHRPATTEARPHPEPTKRIPWGKEYPRTELHVRYTERCVGGLSRYARIPVPPSQRPGRHQCRRS